ncbi:MAG: DUF5723 family protein [Bacteroidota bacterium]
MKKIFFILFFISCFSGLKAQMENDYFSTGRYKACAYIGANIDLASSSVSNHFMNTFLWKDSIDITTKQWMFDALDKNNVTGFDYNDRLSFITFPDTFAGTTDMGIFVSYGNHYHIDMDVTRDVLKLFYGANTQYKGKTADIGNSSLNLIYYQQLQLGVVSKFGNGRLHHSFGLGISINNGIQNTRINIDHGSIYTEKDAKYIDISAAYEINRSDTSGSAVYKGFGTSLNIYYSFFTDKKNSFGFSVTDLGFIRWNKNSQQFTKDTAIHFEGVIIDDPLDIEGNIFGNSNPDSVINTYTYADTAMAYFMLTPACFKISYLYNLSDKFRIEGSLIKKLYIHYDLLFMLKALYAFGENNIFSVNINYGGYSGSNPLKSHNINTGIEYAHRFGKGLVINIGTNYLNGFINPYSQTAQGAYVSIKKYFF